MSVSRICRPQLAVFPPEPWVSIPGGMVRIDSNQPTSSRMRFTAYTRTYVPESPLNGDAS